MVLTVVAQLLPGYYAHLPGRPDVHVRAHDTTPGLLEVCVDQGPWQPYDGRGGPEWLDWQTVADGVQVRATAVPIMRWEVRRRPPPAPAGNGAWPARHRVDVLAAVTDPARDWRSVRLTCPVAGCAVGRIDGAPSAWIGRVVAAIQADHAG